MHSVNLNTSLSETKTIQKHLTRRRRRRQECAAGNTIKSTDPNSKPTNNNQKKEEIRFHNNIQSNIKKL